MTDTFVLAVICILTGILIGFVLAALITVRGLEEMEYRLDKAENLMEYWCKKCQECSPDWIPVRTGMPDIDEDGYSDKVLVCFDKTSWIEICEFRVNDGIGRWYVGDMEDSPEDVGLQVVAWMPLPERWKEENA